MKRWADSCSSLNREGAFVIFKRFVMRLSADRVLILVNYAICFYIEAIG